MVEFYDVTLRDGNHALRHKLDPSFVREYCSAAEMSPVWAVEVGHGNGLGASSFLVGKSAESDESLLAAARDSLHDVKLAVHAIPGFATIKRDLAPAVEMGVDVFRIATHVSEASLAQKHIEYLTERGVLVHGVLMMSHMTDIQGLVEQAALMTEYGASAVVLMDSAGHFLPADVSRRIRALREDVGVNVGFHAHNNMGMAVANAMEAVNVGAEVVDGAAMGLGAGSGNAQLECVLANRQRQEPSHASMDQVLIMSQLVESTFPSKLPRTNASSIESGEAGVFSGYAPHVVDVSAEFGVSAKELWTELGKRRLVAGQESMIREIAQDLMNL
ncbi:4-hydroxy-2-oxovalerate aldolase [bacterium]|nr:4-hydroxy-2-oxovalerate aldolase [bacterium]